MTISPSELESTAHLTFSKYEIEVIYEFFQHQYIHYENTKLLNLIKTMRQFLEENK